MKRWLMAVLASVVVCAPGSAAAQWVVQDPANLAQNILSVSQEAQQVAGQIQEIQHQFDQLQHMKQDLEQLAPEEIQDLQDAFRRLGELYEAAEQISMAWSDIVSEYEALYGLPDVTDPADIRAKREAWGAQTDQAMEAAFQAHGVVEDFGSRSATIEAMAEASREGEGTLEAIQAGNELSRLMAEQQLETMELLAADSRALASHAREEQARREAAELRTQYQFGSGWEEVQGPEREVPQDLPRF